MLSEKRLRNNIKKMRKQLTDLNGFNITNPLRWHWWTKWKYRRIAKQYERLLLYIIIETVALDPRYRNGTWSIIDTVPELINKGLASDRT
jgi:hypothetical protein